MSKRREPIRTRHIPILAPPKPSSVTYVPPQMATTARDLLLAFYGWMDSRDPELLRDDAVDGAALVDMFIKECSGP